MALRQRDITILGIGLDNLTAADLTTRVQDWVTARRRGLSGPAHQIATVNPEFIMTARRDPLFHRALAEVDLATADGVGLTLAARIQGHPFRQRLPGVEMVFLLIAQAARSGQRIFLLGAAPGVAEAAAVRWWKRYPSLEIAGCFAGSPYDEEAPAIIARIAATRADILLVAFGAPAQDLWIARYRDELGTAGVSVAIGVGGVFDYASGRVPRAPRLFRDAGLEWAYRLYQQPWRWRRMLALPRFGLLVLAERLGIS